MIVVAPYNLLRQARRTRPVSCRSVTPSARWRRFSAGAAADSASTLLYLNLPSQDCARRELAYVSLLALAPSATASADRVAETISASAARSTEVPIWSCSCGRRVRGYSVEYLARCRR